jgi:hypothetical protein
MSILPASMELIHPSRIPQVSAASAIAPAAMAAIVGASSLSLGGVGPRFKKANSRAYLLPPLSMCVCVSICLLCGLSLLSSFLSTKKVISGLQEAYLGDSKRSSTNYAPGTSPVLDFEESMQEEAT